MGLLFRPHDELTTFSFSQSRSRRRLRKEAFETLQSPHWRGRNWVSSHRDCPSPLLQRNNSSHVPSTQINREGDPTNARRNGLDVEIAHRLGNAAQNSRSTARGLYQQEGGNAKVDADPGGEVVEEQELTGELRVQGE